MQNDNFNLCVSSLFVCLAHSINKFNDASKFRDGGEDLFEKFKSVEQNLWALSTRNFPDWDALGWDFPWRGNRFSWDSLPHSALTFKGWVISETSQEIMITSHSLNCVRSISMILKNSWNIQSWMWEEFTQLISELALSFIPRRIRRISLDFINIAKRKF